MQWGGLVGGFAGGFGSAYRQAASGGLRAALRAGARAAAPEMIGVVGGAAVAGVLGRDPLHGATWGMFGVGAAGGIGRGWQLWRQTGKLSSKVHQTGKIAPSNGVTMAPNAVLTHTADLVRQYAPRVTPTPGFTDVFIHGTRSGNAFSVLHNGQWVTVSHRSLATYLRNQGVTGNVRLISCNAGAGNAGQNLANQLGVTVRGPTNVITMHPNGTLTAPTGTVWQDFAPGVRP